MDRNYIDDHHVVARYLADDLSETERRDFEACYLEHPEVLQEMEAAARFKLGLAQLEESGELAGLLAPRPWFRQQRNIVLAAGAAIVAFGLFVFLGRGPSAQPVLLASTAKLVDRFGAPLPTLGTYSILRTRSSAFAAEIPLPASAQIVALRILPEVEAQPARYRIALYSIDDNDAADEIAQVGGLVPESDGFVPVYLNSANVRAGRYRLAVSGEVGTSAANDRSEFLIRMVDDAP